MYSSFIGFLPKHVVQHVSPLPKLSPSSILSGIAWPLVSGNRSTQRPDMSETTPKTIAGIFGSKESNKVMRGVKAPAKRAHIDPSPIAEFLTTVGNNSAE